MLEWIDAGILAATILAVLVRLAEPFGHIAWLAKLALILVASSALFGIAQDIGSRHVYLLWPLGMHAGICAFIVYRIFESARRTDRGHAHWKNGATVEKLRHRAF